MHFETKAVHEANHILRKTTDVVPPIHKTTVFEHPKEGHNDGELNYTRAANPNRLRLENVLKELEEGSSCAAFSSGVAAATAVFHAFKPGDHILVPGGVYAGNRLLINDVMIPWGLQVDFVSMTNVSDLAKEFKENTKLVWVETPSNPMFTITDIAAVSDLAHEHGAKVCVDNTWPTPFNQLPLKLGADLCLHSTTKYFGGHSDILGGAVISKKDSEVMDMIRRLQLSMGAVPSPEDCWMVCRSTQTLPYRMRAHNNNAAKLARFLQDHERVTKVFYAGLETHPGHNIAKKQMRGFGGMISFLIDGDAEDARAIVARSKIIKRATSLGGVESTWEQRKSSEGEDSATPENLIRISVGLEHPDDLLEDVEQALR